MTNDADDLKSRAKQTAQEIQKIQTEASGLPAQQDLGSPAEDDGADAATRFAHEVKQAEDRAKTALGVGPGRRPR